MIFHRPTWSCLRSTSLAAIGYLRTSPTREPLIVPAVTSAHQVDFHPAFLEARKVRVPLVFTDRVDQLASNEHHSTIQQAFQRQMPVLDYCNVALNNEPYEHTVVVEKQRLSSIANKINESLRPILFIDAEVAYFSRQIRYLSREYNIPTAARNVAAYGIAEEDSALATGLADLGYDEFVRQNVADLYIFFGEKSRSFPLDTEIIHLPFRTINDTYNDLRALLMPEDRKRPLLRRSGKRRPWVQQVRKWKKAYSRKQAPEIIRQLAKVLVTSEELEYGAVSVTSRFNLAESLARVYPEQVLSSLIYLEGSAVPLAMGAARSLSEQDNIVNPVLCIESGPEFLAHNVGDLFSIVEEQLPVILLLLTSKSEDKRYMNLARTCGLHYEYCSNLEDLPLVLKQLRCRRPPVILEVGA